MRILRRQLRQKVERRAGQLHRAVDTDCLVRRQGVHGDDAIQLHDREGAARYRQERAPYGTISCVQRDHADEVQRP